MSLTLQSTDFELFDVPARFVQERDALDARWKELQREAHPDRFAAQGGAAQRVAMQWSVRSILVRTSWRSHSRRRQHRNARALSGAADGMA